MISSEDDPRLGNIPGDCHPKIRAVGEYWLSIHPEKGLPGRQHLNPKDIPQLLASVRLLDVCGEPPRLRARLMGTILVDFLGRDYTGQWLDVAYPDLPGSPMERDYLNVIATKQPHWRFGKPYLSHHKKFSDIERVIFPLARDGETVDMLFSVYVFHGADNDVG